LAQQTTPIPTSAFDRPHPDTPMENDNFVMLVIFVPSSAPLLMKGTENNTLPETGVT